MSSKSCYKTFFMFFIMTFTLFSGIVYAQTVTSPNAITIASEPVPFVDQGLHFIPLKKIAKDLSGQTDVDFSELRTSNKHVYTFKNGMIASLQIPIIRQDGNYGFQVGSNSQGKLCQVIVQDKNGLFWHQVSLKKQGDGSYKAILSSEITSVKTLPEHFNLILVSRAVPIDSTLEFSLTKLSKLGITRTSDMSVNSEIGTPLSKMFKDSSQANNFELRVVSGFRTVTKQRSLFNAKMAALKSQGSKNPFEDAAKTVNPPTQSEHHTGYAVDILSTRVVDLGSFKGTPEAQWLDKNSYQYGFVVRYPEGKTKITAISYEPWHLRYVGKTYAKLLKDKKITLEEWISNGKKGVLYKTPDRKTHYFIVVETSKKAEMLKTLISTTTIEKYYISPKWSAYDMVIPEEPSILLKN